MLRNKPTSVTAKKILLPLTLSQDHFQENHRDRFILSPEQDHPQRSQTIKSGFLLKVKHLRKLETD